MVGAGGRISAASAERQPEIGEAILDARSSPRDPPVESCQAIRGARADDVAITPYARRLRAKRAYEPRRFPAARQPDAGPTMGWPPLRAGVGW